MKHKIEIACIFNSDLRSREKVRLQKIHNKEMHNRTYNTELRVQTFRPERMLSSLIFLISHG